MKVIVSEGCLGVEYIADAISSCEQNGIECIADDKGGVILYYDPKGRKYADSKYLMNSDNSIHELLKDKKLYGEIMQDAVGEGFKKFAIQWNALQKEEDDEVYKTKHCNPIRGNFSESLDDEGEVEIMWDTDAYEDFGIFKGDCSTYLVDYKRVDDSDDLVCEVCKMIGKEYPDLDFEPDDFTIVNEREFWGQREQNMVYPYDESNEDVVKGIPNWATTYIMYGDVPGDMTEGDVELVDNYLEKLAKRGIRLIEPIEGTENEFNANPAFGLASDTTDWSCECGMYTESESNGRTLDVTLSFTRGHYGKNLKVDDERTIKVDLDAAPELYDEDDLMDWISEIASDQIPGGGTITKYYFKVLDMDRLVNALTGGKGFGTDLDIDIDDPDSIPSDISYKDAVNIYKQIYDAYDNRKLNYNKFDVLRKKVVDSVVAGLLKGSSIEELAKVWFIDYGTRNGWGWKTSFRYNIAAALHAIHMKKHPDEHRRLPQHNHWSGWHEDNCSCGLASSSDSSD